MAMPVVRENVTVVLKGPKYPGNVGSVARCAKNFGVERLVVVGPPPEDMEPVRRMATHLAADVVDGIRFVESLPEALMPFRHVVGTTARHGNFRGPMVKPREAAARLCDLSRNNDVALLFGPEDTGLTTEELRLCRQVVTIPTSERFRSLNLSHAVMLLCYEIFLADREETAVFTPRLATTGEVEGLHAHIADILMKIGFLNPQNPEYWMTHIRRFLARTALQSKEVKILRGICRQLQWYLENKKT